METDANIESWEELAAKRHQRCHHLNQAAARFEVKPLALKAENRAEEGKGGVASSRKDRRLLRTDPWLEDWALHPPPDPSTSRE